jgi:hypothetical protein
MFTTLWGLMLRQRYCHAHGPMLINSTWIGSTSWADAHHCERSHVACYCHVPWPPCRWSIPHELVGLHGSMLSTHCERSHKRQHYYHVMSPCRWSIPHELVDFIMSALTIVRGLYVACSWLPCFMAPHVVGSIPHELIGLTWVRCSHQPLWEVMLHVAG